MSSAKAQVAIENDRVRVTRWVFAGDRGGTGHHAHEFDYIVVPVSGGEFAVSGEDGSVTRMVQRQGEPYLGTAGTRHDVRDCGAPASFVEIELKR